MNEEEGACAGGNAGERKRHRENARNEKRGESRFGKQLGNDKTDNTGMRSDGSKKGVWSGARACMQRLSQLRKRCVALVGCAVCCFALLCCLAWRALVRKQAWELGGSGNPG